MFRTPWMRKPETRKVIDKFDAEQSIASIPGSQLLFNIEKHISQNRSERPGKTIVFRQTLPYNQLTCDCYLIFQRYLRVS